MGRLFYLEKNMQRTVTMKLMNVIIKDSYRRSVVLAKELVESNELTIEESILQKHIRLLLLAILYQAFKDLWYDQWNDQEVWDKLISSYARSQWEAEVISKSWKDVVRYMLEVWYQYRSNKYEKANQNITSFLIERLSIETDLNDSSVQGIDMILPYHITSQLNYRNEIVSRWEEKSYIEQFENWSWVQLATSTKDYWNVLWRISLGEILVTLLAWILMLLIFSISSEWWFFKSYVVAYSKFLLLFMLAVILSLAFGWIYRSFDKETGWVKFWTTVSILTTVLILLVSAVHLESATYIKQNLLHYAIGFAIAVFLLREYIAYEK